MRTNHLTIVTSAGSVIVLALVVAILRVERPTDVGSTGKSDGRQSAIDQSTDARSSARAAQELEPSRVGARADPRESLQAPTSDAASFSSPKAAKDRKFASDSVPSEQGSLESTDSYPRVEEDVAGRPFPLSPSVMRQCVSRLPSESDCPQLMEFLLEFERESRSAAWAQAMEGQLKKALTHTDPGKFSVRTIECRSNRCFAEVSAPFEGHLGDIDSFPELSARLYGPVVSNLGFEAGPNGERIFVTAMGFERR
jgi:hypothetical protein